MKVQTNVNVCLLDKGLEILHDVRFMKQRTLMLCMSKICVVFHL